MGRDNQGNQGGRSGNLSDDDRSRGGETSANEQDRDSQGQFTGMSGRGGSSGGQGGNRGGSNSDQDRDDQGQFTSSRGGSSRGGNQGGGSSQGGNR